MPFPYEEGGGLSLTLDMAAHQAHLLWINYVETAPPHAEHANFFVETLQVENIVVANETVEETVSSVRESADDEAARNATAKDATADDESADETPARVPSLSVVTRGYAIEAVTPAVALRRAGKSLWFSGAPVEVPAPLLLPDEWTARRSG